MNGSSVIPVWIQVMSTTVIGIFITLHLVRPDLPIDTTTILLLGFLLAVWFLPYVKKVKMPGGPEFELRDKLREAEQSFAKAPIQSRPQKKAEVTTQPVLDEEASIRTQLLEEDLNLALASLRIEIEKRLREIARRQNVFFGKRVGISGMLRALRQREAIDPYLGSALADVIAIGNQAVHGARVDYQTAKRTLGLGEGLLGALNDIIESGER